MTDNRNWKQQFIPIWVGQAFSLLGSNLVSFALVWWLTEQTGSATVLATGTLVTMIPGVLLGPFAGALVDRWNRKTVMIVADSLVALFTVCLAAGFHFGEVQVWHVYVLNFLRSLSGTFHWPAMHCSTGLMVPEQHLTRLNGINRALRGVLQMAAPPLGALLMSVLPIAQVLLIDVFTAALAVAPLFFVQIPQPKKKATVEKTSLVTEIKQAVVYVRGWRALAQLMCGATVLNFLMAPAFALLPLLVTNRFGGGATELAWLESAMGIGLIAGGLLIGAWGGFKRKTLTIVGGAFGMAVGVLVLAAAPADCIWIGLAGLAITGLMNPICNSPIFAMMQSAVEPSMQGRVLMVFGSMCELATPLAMIIAGPVADAVGVDIWYWVAAIGTLSITVLMGSSPALWRLDEQAAERQRAIAEQREAGAVPALTSAD